MDGRFTSEKHMVSTTCKLVFEGYGFSFEIPKTTLNVVEISSHNNLRKAEIVFDNPTANLKLGQVNQVEKSQDEMTLYLKSANCQVFIEKVLD